MKRINVAFILSLIVLVFSTFVLWSFLAIISLYWNPFKGFNLVFFNNHINSSLAQSIFSEIISAYFSFCTLIHLLLVIDLISFCVLLVKNLAVSVFIFSEIQSPLKLIINRLFFLSEKILVDLLDSRILNSYQNKPYPIYGPARISIPDNFASVLITNHQDIQVAKYRKSNLLSLDKKDTLLGLVDISERTLFIESQSKSLPFFRKSVRIRYKIIRDEYSNSKENALETLVRFCEIKDIHNILESIIEWEFHSLMKQFENYSSEEFHEKKKSQSTRANHSCYHLWIHPIKRNSFLNFLRKRRRNLYQFIQESSIQINSKIDFIAEINKCQKELGERIDNIMIRLFGIKIIELIELQFGG